MTDILQNIISILINDSTLATLMNTSVPNKNIFTGAIDIVKETQASLAFPTVILYAISESFRTVPQGVRDSRVQLTLVSRNSEKEVQDMYERIAVLLNFTSGNKNNSWIAWERGSGLSSQYDSSMRLWQLTFDITVWSV